MSRNNDLARIPAAGGNGGAHTVVTFTGNGTFRLD